MGWNAKTNTCSGDKPEVKSDYKGGGALNALFSGDLSTSCAAIMPRLHETW